MSERQQPQNHEHIARLLREQGPAEAPPGLAPEVMRQVRAEPRERRMPRVRWRPAAGIAAAAACLLALGVGLAHVGNGASSGSGAGTAGGAEALAPQDAARSAPAAGTYTIAKSDAEAIFGSAVGGLASGDTAKAPAAGEPVDLKRVPQGLRAVAAGAAYHQLARKLAYAAAHPGSGPTVVVVLTRHKQ